MSFRRRTDFSTLLLVSLTINVALLMHWMMSPAGPFFQMTESSAAGAVCAQEAQLELSDDQLRRLSELRSEYQSFQYDQCEYVRAARLEMLSVLENPEATAKDTLEQREKILRKQDEVLLAAMDRLLAERAILDDEQRARWFDHLRAKTTCTQPDRERGQRVPAARIDPF